MAEQIRSGVEVYTTPPALGGQKQRFTVEPGDLLPPVKAQKRKKSDPEPPYLVLGFDTEFEGPGAPVTRSDITEGRAKYEVVSYQFHAKTSDGREWCGICCPEGDERMSIGEFLVFALGLGARQHGLRNIPATIYLVGHFTRADIPAFSDFHDQIHFMSSLRSTIVTVDATKIYSIALSNGLIAPLHVRIRDTMLLTPQMSRSLATIGDLVGVPKLQLDQDPKKHKDLIKKMAYVRDHHWEAFREYALNDAKICVYYIEQIIEQYRAVTGKRKVPITLTSIGVDLLFKSWGRDFQGQELELLGKEEVSEQVFDKKAGRYKKMTRRVDLPEVDLHAQYAIESYHGGRNEQFWFGPCFEDRWIDCDLSSAYPTAMSLICKPDWRAIRTTTDINDFTPDALGKL